MNEVVKNESCRVCVVGTHANNLGCGQVDLVGSFGGHKSPHSGLLGEVDSAWVLVMMFLGALPCASS